MLKKRNHPTHNDTKGMPFFHNSFMFRKEKDVLVYIFKKITSNSESQMGQENTQIIFVDSYNCLWSFIECFKRFFGLQSSLGITNVNRSHNKPLELIETI